MSYEDENLQNVISLQTIWQSLWSRRLLIGLTTGVGLLISIAYTLITGPSYTVTMIVIPSVSDTESSSMFGQLPSFLGNNDAQPVSKFRQFQTAVFSTEAAAVMERKFGALCDIDKRCDPATRKWLPRPAWRKTASDIARTVLGMPAKPDEPQLSDLVSYTNNHVTAANEKSFLTLTMIDSRPERAKVFLRHLVEATNGYIKAKDSVSLDQYVRYLSDRLDHLESVSQREPLTALLMTEERRLMLTHVDVPYAATPFDGPVSEPRSALLKFEIGIAAGFILGCLLALGMAFGLIRMPAPGRSERRIKSSPAAFS